MPFVFFGLVIENKREREKGSIVSTGVVPVHKKQFFTVWPESCSITDIAVNLFSQEDLLPF